MRDGHDASRAIAPAANTTVTVDVVRWFRQELFIGAFVVTCFGGSGIVAGVFDLTTGGTGTRIAAGLICLPFAAVGFGLFFWLFARTPRGWLDVDSAGLRLRGRSGAGWHLAWSETSLVSVVRTRLSVTTGFSGTRRYFNVRFPRHHLRLHVSDAAAVRPDIARALSGPHAHLQIVTLNLGVPPSTARAVLAALGPYAVPPEIVRLNSPYSGPEDWGVE